MLAFLSLVTPDHTLRLVKPYARTSSSPRILLKPTGTALVESVALKIMRETSRSHCFHRFRS